MDVITKESTINVDFDESKPVCNYNSYSTNVKIAYEHKQGYESRIEVDIPFIDINKVNVHSEIPVIAFDKNKSDHDHVNWQLSEPIVTKSEVDLLQTKQNEVDVVLEKKSCKFVE